MKLAIIGSRDLQIDNLEKYIPPGVSEIVSGGAKGVDSLAEIYAQRSGIPLKLFLPQYPRYGRGAPLKRNIEIISYADAVLAFWDGKSKGTKYVIENCKKRNVPLMVYLLKDGEFHRIE